MPKHTFIAMVQIETDDPRCSPDVMNGAVTTAETAAALRRLVLQHLPSDVTRLVAVMPVEHARLLMMLHEATGKDLGADIFKRPPQDYVPPTRE